MNNQDLQARIAQILAGISPVGAASGAAAGSAVSTQATQAVQQFGSDVSNGAINAGKALAWYVGFIVIFIILLYVIITGDTDPSPAVNYAKRNNNNG